MVNVPGEALTYQQSGSVITNNPTFQAPKNLAQTISDLSAGNVEGLTFVVASCTASASSGTNYFTIPSTITQNSQAVIASSAFYDGVNIQSTGTVTGVGILFPSNTLPGQIFLIVCDVAVTSLHLVTPAGYTINNAPTSATQYQTFRFFLQGSVWKQW